MRGILLESVTQDSASLKPRLSVLSHKAVRQDPRCIMLVASLNAYIKFLSVLTVSNPVNLSKSVYTATWCLETNPASKSVHTATRCLYPP